MSRFPQLAAFRGGAGLIRLVGHRGARGIMPENTIEGFEVTLASGVEALEFDVVLTADAVPVITHNHRLGGATTRGPDGNWLGDTAPKLSELTLAELRHYDVGGLNGQTEYGRRFPDQAFLNGLRIPALRDLLALANRPANAGLHLLLELKSDPSVADPAGARRLLVDRVVTELRAHGLAGRTVLHSFDWALLDECRRQAPDMPTSYLSQLTQAGAIPGEDAAATIAPGEDGQVCSLPRAVHEAGGQMWCPHFDDLTPALVREAQALGLLVTTWTVNETPDIEAMIDAGVDGIVTDYPGRVQHCLLNRGLRWTAAG